jgi:putative addiction module component (TIGR02574 family)
VNELNRELVERGARGFFEREGEALCLSTADRARLASLLLESLDDDEDDKQVAAAWEVEVARRRAEYRSGDVATIPATEVFRKARSWVRGAK